MRAPVDYRALAVELVEFACGGAHGRPETDPVYQAVTEGRDRPPFPNQYSSCGDLAHWMLYRLGVRLPMVNRGEHRGWTSGANVARLAYDRTAVFAPRPDARYLPGDIGVIWSKHDGTDAHVFVILDDAQPGALYVGEYGQPGGKLSTRKVDYPEGVLAIGHRKLYSVLRLSEVLDAAEAAKRLEEPETADDWTRRVLPELFHDTDPAPPTEAA